MIDSSIPEVVSKMLISNQSWQKYYLDILEVVARKSTCLRRRVGALAVKDKRIIATGYNGAPSGVDHCEISGCLREELHIPSGQQHEKCRAVHAEQNIITQCARFGMELEGADIYCTHLPCFICFKMLVNCKVKRIYFLNGYPDEMTLDMYRKDSAILPELIQLVIE